MKMSFLARVGSCAIPCCVANAVAAAATALTVGFAAAQTPVKVSLDSRFEGPAAPFLLGLDKGYYKAEGLDVTIDPSTGSRESIARVASGAYDIGFGDINTLIRLRDQNSGGAAKAVFMVYNRPPFAIVTRKSRGVAKPKDLEGKKLGAPTADATFAQWKVFTKANGIDAAKVEVEDVGVPVREPMLAAGEVDAVTGYAFSSYVNLKDRGVPVDDIVVLPMADYGVNLYGSAIIVSQKFAAAHPDAVRKFLRAFTKSLKDTVRDPPAAIDSVLRRNDLAKKDVELERLRMALNHNILTPEVEANGYGQVDMARLDRSIGQIAQSYDFKVKPKATDIFDPTFLPPAADRNTD
jgi:NitT/TauT family transport system substrate-binding protein